MPILKNQRWELFSLAIVSGQTAGDAYVAAGYKRSNSSPYQLLENPRVKDRIAELRAQKTEIIVQKAAISRTWVLDNLRENVEYAKHTNVANRALELIGKEIGMFVEKRDVRHVAEFEKLSDLELLQLIERETRKLLEDNSGGAGDAGEEGGEGSAEGEDDHGD